MVDQIYLEDFASTSAIYSQLKSQVNLQSLRLSISFEESDRISSRELYTMAVKRLKCLFPNLQRLSLNGGYIYRPAKEVQLIRFKISIKSISMFQTTEAVIDEVCHLRHHLDMLSSILVESKVPFLRLNFSAIFAFEENVSSIDRVSQA